MGRYLLLLFLVGLDLFLSSGDGRERAESRDEDGAEAGEARLSSLDKWW